MRAPTSSRTRSSSPPSRRVGAAAQLRAIRQAAYADVRLFRNLEAAGGHTRDRRRMLERIADQLGDLELELSYSVEASADLGLLVPSLRAESFHNALYESMGLAGKAATAGRMLERLGAAISAELTAIESIERRADENRRIRYAVAVGFVSAVAIPASLILAFLGINASQVTRTCPCSATTTSACTWPSPRSSCSAWRAGGWRCGCSSAATPATTGSRGAATHGGPSVARRVSAQ